MAITADMVKALRDRTGAGMMDCKAALTEANGDMDAAIDVLRKKGIAKAARKAERGASDGVVATWLAPDGRAGLIAEINCETDFVARTDDFKALVQFVLDQASTAGDGATEAWAKDPAGPSSREWPSSSPSSARTWASAAWCVSPTAGSWGSTFTSAARSAC